MKLTKKDRLCLGRLAATDYVASLDYGYVWLAQKGLAENIGLKPSIVHSNGDVTFKAAYRITPAGRKALEDK